ncbi:MAG: DNA-3-methyladenine glycosylase [Patescibacteria group bacterium]
MKKKSKNILLSRRFFERDAQTVARELLGKFLVRRHYSPLFSNSRELENSKKWERVAVMITETEAYGGPRDKASHAHSGRTKRNEPMWGEAGIWYVYLCYGMHEMLNIVTGPKEYPAAVLIRGTEFDGRRADGPGKITKTLKIGRMLNNKKAVRASGLWIEDRGVKLPPRGIRRAARIGVSYAGTVWSAKKYRFTLHTEALLESNFTEFASLEKKQRPLFFLQ